MHTYALRIRAGDRSIGVSASASSITGALQGQIWAVAYLGVGGLGYSPEKYNWHDVVVTTRARRVVLIHWDDYTRPLTQPLVAMPYAVDNLSRTLAIVRELAAASDVDLRMPTLGQPTDPAHGLP